MWPKAVRTGPRPPHMVRLPLRTPVEPVPLRDEHRHELLPSGHETTQPGRQHPEADGVWAVTGESADAERTLKPSS